MGVDASMASSALKLFEQAEEQGLGEKDMSAVVEVVRRASQAGSRRTK
jgi:3-hydroxyisobutyrate dehydrogenase-like beta-hydroxyacid dehydrogenase